MAGDRRNSTPRRPKTGWCFSASRPARSPRSSKNPDPKGHPLLVKVKDVLTFGEELEVPVDLVVLAVGQEPNNIADLVEKMKIPVGADRFLQEVHPKLRPVEVSVAGILLAGTCQAPFDVGETCAAAGAAAVKAAAILTRGYVDLDPFVAEVDLSKCTGTGACVAACLAEGALTMVDAGGGRPKGQAGPGQPGPVPGLRRLCGGLPGKRH